MQVSTKHRRCIASAVLAATSATQFVEALQLHQNGFTTAVGRFGKTMKTKLNDVVSRSGAVVPDDKFSQEFDNEDRWTKKWKRVAEERKRQIGKGKIPSYDFMTAFSEGLRLPKRMLTSEQRQKIYAKAEQYAVDAIYAEQSDNLHPKHWTTPDVSIFSLWQLNFDFFETSVQNYIFGPPTDSQDIRVILNKSVDQPLTSMLQEIYRKTFRKYIKHEETPFATNLYFKAASIAKFNFFAEDAFDQCQKRIGFLKNHRHPEHLLEMTMDFAGLLKGWNDGPTGKPSFDEAVFMYDEPSWIRAFDPESVTQEDRSMMHLAIRIRRYNAIVYVLGGGFELEGQIPQANFLLAHVQIKEMHPQDAVVEHELHNRAVQITLQDQVFKELKRRGKGVFAGLTYSERQLVANHATYQFKDIVVQPENMLKQTTDAYTNYSAFVDELNRCVNVRQYNFLDSFDVVLKQIMSDIKIQFDNFELYSRSCYRAIWLRYEQKRAEAKADIEIFQNHMKLSKENLITRLHQNKDRRQLSKTELQAIDDAWNKKEMWDDLVEACESKQYDFLATAKENAVFVELENTVKQNYEVSDDPRFERIVQLTVQRFISYQQHVQGEVFFTAFMRALDQNNERSPTFEQVKLVYDDLNDTPIPLTEQQKRFIEIDFPPMFHVFLNADDEERAAYQWWRQTHKSWTNKGIVKAFLRFYARCVEFKKLLNKSNQSIDDVHRAAVSAEFFFPELTPMQKKMVVEYSTNSETESFSDDNEYSTEYQEDYSSDATSEIYRSVNGDSLSEE